VGVAYKLVVLNPAMHFQEIVDQAHAVVRRVDECLVMVVVGMSYYARLVRAGAQGYAIYRPQDLPCPTPRDGSRHPD
jgi:hypothetical protein